MHRYKEGIPTIEKTYISHEGFNRCHGDICLHAVGQVGKQSLSVSAIIPHPEVIKEVQHPTLHHRGQLLLMHVLLKVKEYQACNSQ